MSLVRGIQIIYKITFTRVKSSDGADLRLIFATLNMTFTMQ